MTLFEGLPAPQSGRLVVYLFGPGPGESQVIALPDGRWVVVDGCVADGVNLPLALLRHHQVTEVDLLVVTHPDLDHYRGIAELIDDEAVTVNTLWRYPGLTAQRDLLARLCDLDPSTRRWPELRRLLDAVDQLARDNQSFQVALGHGAWSPTDADYRIEIIAPCPADIQVETELLQSVFNAVARGRRLIDADGRVQIERALGGHGNTLSLALSLRWGEARLLFGGDVEAHATDVRRGWAGILSVLELGRTDLLRDMSAVKVAHHGSNGAIHTPTWQLHASHRKDLHAVITPFAPPATQPPHLQALRSLRDYATHLHLTSEPPANWQVVEQATWKATTESGCAATSAAVVLEIERTGTVRHHRGAVARSFVPA